MSRGYGYLVAEPSRPIDVRFLLANERTLLAWVRTALALLAAAGGVFEFTDVSGRRGLAICLAVAGVAAAGAGGWRYAVTARHIRAGEPVTNSTGPELLAGAVAVLGVALVIALLV